MPQQVLFQSLPDGIPLCPFNFVLQPKQPVDTYNPPAVELEFAAIYVAATTQQHPSINLARFSGRAIQKYRRQELKVNKPACDTTAKSNSTWKKEEKGSGRRGETVSWRPIKSPEFQDLPT
jgi:hypothetical protein